LLLEVFTLLELFALLALFVAAALWALAAKLPADTPPPLCLAVDDWILLASFPVMGVLPDISRCCKMLDKGE
jgi:hypothetical protein